MAKRRRAAEPGSDHERAPSGRVTAIALEPTDFINPTWRVVFFEDEPAHLAADPTALVAWYRAAHPGAILTEEEARFEVSRGSREDFADPIDAPRPRPAPDRRRAT